MQFILDKTQRDLFKSAWKNFLTVEAKQLKKNIRDGRNYKSRMWAHHILRHILLTDLSKIEHKIVQAFANQSEYKHYIEPARAGLETIVSDFQEKRKTYLPGNYGYTEFLATLTAEQLVQINSVAASINAKYISGEIK
jgi:hypothetical protein